MGTNQTTEKCEVSSVIPTYVTISYLAVYLSSFFFVSLKAFFDVKKRENEDEWNNKTLSEKMKLWKDDIWIKRECYLHALPHIFDQCTDVAVVIQFYLLFQSSDTALCGGLSMSSFFYWSIAIIVVYRLISSIQIGLRTYSVSRVFLQLLDLELLRTLYINYKTAATKPNVAQTWIMVLEATFESAPQFVLQLVFAARTGIIATSFSIYHISIFWSLFTVILRNATDDLMMSINIAKLDFIIFRSFDIATRLLLLSLIWIVFDGYILAVIIGVELGILIIISAVTQNYELLHFILKTLFPYHLDIIRIIESSITISAVLIAFFQFKRNYNIINLVLCVITAFSFGINLLLWGVLKCKITHELNQNSNQQREDGRSHHRQFSTSRNLNKLIDADNWEGVNQMIEYGSATNWQQLWTLLLFSQNSLNDRTITKRICDQVYDDHKQQFDPNRTTEENVFVHAMKLKTNSLGSMQFLLSLPYINSNPSSDIENVNLSPIEYAISTNKQKYIETLLQHYQSQMNNDNNDDNDNKDAGDDAADNNDIDESNGFKNIIDIIENCLVSYPIKPEIVVQLLQYPNISVDRIFCNAAIEFVTMTVNRINDNDNADNDNADNDHSDDGGDTNDEMIEYLIELIGTLINDYNVDVTTHFNEFGTEQTILHYIISKCCMNEVSLKLIAIILCNENINEAINNKTALMICFERNWIQCINQLLAHSNIELMINDQSLFKYFKRWNKAKCIELVHCCLQNNIELEFEDTTFTEIACFLVENRSNIENAMNWVNQKATADNISTDLINICLTNTVGLKFDNVSNIEIVARIIQNHLKIPRALFRVQSLINNDNINNIAYGNTALMHALNQGWSECIVYLITHEKQGWTVNKQSLFAWYKQNDETDLLITLILYCIDNDIEIDISNRNIEYPYFMRLLILNYGNYQRFIQAKNSKITSKILTCFEKWCWYQIDLNHKDREKTILMIAIDKKWNECIQILIDNNTATKIENMSLLLYYSRYGYWNEALILLKTIQYKVNNGGKCNIDFKEKDNKGHDVNYYIKKDDNDSKSIRTQIQQIIKNINPISFISSWL